MTKQNFEKQKWGFVMSPGHPGQLNTSYYGLASLKRLINPSDQPPDTVTKKHPATSTNPYMGNTGQHPHKWQEIELLERMWSVWALERCLFIHSWSGGQIDFMGSKIRSKGDA